MKSPMLSQAKRSASLFRFAMQMKQLFVTYLVLLIVGCALERPYEPVVGFVRYSQETFPPTSKVEVFSHDVEKPYTIIGELKMTFSPELRHEEMVNRMKEVSQGIGADAIIGLKRDTVEVTVPEVFREPIKRKARHQPLEISSPEAREEKVLLRGLAIRYW